MSLSLAPAQDRARLRDQPALAEQVRLLQGRIRGMQATKLASRALPTRADLAELLPGGALQAGSAYTVTGSTALLMALLAGPSAAGSWCGVVGVPDFGVEAAAGLGIDLSRLVLIPSPGDQWLTVTAAVADVLTVVAVRPPARVSPGDAARLGARLRERGAVLIALGDWPQAEASLSVAASEWEGVGAGHGYLTERRLTVAATTRNGGARPHIARLRLPEGRGVRGAAAERHDAGSAALASDAPREPLGTFPGLLEDDALVGDPLCEVAG
jgi:hypothetical protein